MILHVVDSFKAFQDAVDAVEKFTKLPYFILQDYVEGVTASVSLLSDGQNALPLSLNFQNVQLKDGKIDYNGGHVPLKHGKFENTYWGDSELYKKAVEYGEKGRGLENPQTVVGGECPQNCGLCSEHEGS